LVSSSFRATQSNRDLIWVVNDLAATLALAISAMREAAAEGEHPTGLHDRAALGRVSTAA
jgi:hypothetical protein